MFKCITTGISLIFGIYSFYNILTQLQILNNNHKEKINNHKENLDNIKYLVYLINVTNKLCNDLQIKHKKILTKYNDLFINYEQINKKIRILNNKMIELQDNKMIELQDNKMIELQDNKMIELQDNELNIIIKNNIEIDEVSIDSINCDELDKELIDNEFIESLSLEYDSQISSVSSTENNWATSTKKFFFG
jgi:hypothetical protein